MKIELFTNKSLAYANKSVFKRVVTPGYVINSKQKFEFGDMLNSSIVIDEVVPGVSPIEFTYLIVEDYYHYYVTGITYISVNKYRLILRRNVWPNIENDNSIGIINRGFKPKSILNNKSNTCSFNKIKQAEIAVKDIYHKSFTGPSWGILYLAQYDEEDNPTIVLDSPQWSVTGDYKNTDNKIFGYYNQVATNKTYSASLPEQNILLCLPLSHENFRCIWFRHDNYKVNYIANDSKLRFKTNTPSEIEVVVENTPEYYPEHFRGIVVIANEYIADIESAKRYISDFTINIDDSAETYNNNLIKTKYYPDKSSVIINPQTEEYLKYETVESYNNDKNSIVIQDLIYYQTSVTDNITKTVTKDLELGNDNMIVGDDYLFNKQGNTILKNYCKSNFGIATTAIFGSGESNLFKISGNNLVLLGSYNYYNYVYTELTEGEVTVTLSKSKINNSTIITEPYSILAMPLFDFKMRDGDSIKVINGVDSQKLFYKTIANYSGSNPLVVDAQIIPYAPEAFNNILEPGGIINYTKLVTTIETNTGYNGAPLIALQSADMTVSCYVDLLPYDDIQKDYTIRNYRMNSPGQDSSYEFNWYDYNTGKSASDMKAFNEGLGDTRIDIDITLKPFGVYMHASPKINPNSLAGSIDFDDMRGLMCNNSIFQCSMTSDAFQTYARENMNFKQVHERDIATLTKSNEVEKANDIIGGITGTLNATMAGAVAGSKIGGKWGGAISAGVGAGAASVGAGAAYTAQGILNTELRSFELESAKKYYNWNIENIKALPDTISRVSTFHQDILNRFYITIDVYGCTPEESEMYDIFVSQVGNNLNANGYIRDYLSNGNYIQADVLRSNITSELFTGYREDLERGVYYYEQI